MASLFSSTRIHLQDASYTSHEALDLAACGKVVSRGFLTVSPLRVTCETCKKTRVYKKRGEE